MCLRRARTAPSSPLSIMFLTYLELDRGWRAVSGRAGARRVRVRDQISKCSWPQAKRGTTSPMRATDGRGST